MSEAIEKESLGFQAETEQLLNLMIHSLYSNKEIFLRELVSNAADALDKLRFEALSDDALYEGDSDLKIRIKFNQEEKSISIIDNGIGMNRSEVIDHIGTIAKSGTKEFFNSLTGDQAKDANLIGQFGVGFYSAFIVADKVRLVTRRAGTGKEHGVRWESTGKGGYDLETVEKEQHGTEITLFLKDDEHEFLEEFRIRNIIQKYSDHIPVPIILETLEEVEDEESKEKSTELKEDVVNKATALWCRAKTDIKDEEYSEFYKHVAHDFTDPLCHIHSRVEGSQEYTMLLYIPSQAPFDLWDRERKHGVKLYVRRVFILEDTEKLMPHYLRFVRGILDSSDLPLNVSREILQENKLVDSMRAGSVKKILGLLEDLNKKEAEKYQTFWTHFGQVFKEGIIEDHTNQAKIAKLSRFATTHDNQEEQTVSLDQYIERMKAGQEHIYYITGENFQSALNSPHLEVFKKRGIEVLLLTDRVDEWVVNHLTEYEGKKLKSVAKGDLDLGELIGEEEKKDIEKTQTENKDLLEKIKTSLGEKVSDVHVSARLTDSPACLVSDENDMGEHLQQLLRASGQAIPESKPVLEININHPIVEKISSEEDNKRFDDWVAVIFDQAVLSGGGQLKDPAGFVQKLNELLLELTDSKIILPD